MSEIEEVVERPNIDDALEEIKKKKEEKSILHLSEENRKINQVDIAQILLEKVKKEKKEGEEAKEAKTKVKEFVNRVFASLNCVVTRKIADPKTKRVIGQKFKYVNDRYGNSIYDYLVYNKNEFEKNIIEKCWKITFDENDNKDCSWIDTRVDIAWVNTKFC